MFKIGKTVSLLYIGMWFGVCVSKLGKETGGEIYVFSNWNFLCVMFLFCSLIYFGYLWGKDE